ncbi:helix-turn-helix domain-containing protein [Streptomyces sp. F001]|uniref:helix-turn-helix domain-containing protein n=1 Tax=Streptomyces sp. F001 TaxID=1510026 RepID=UPI0023EA554F|nr:helix-turn-helix domain-containing protein [Streptomyces sp. F001]
MTPPQVARRLRVSRMPAYAWHARWRNGGVTTLRSKRQRGRPPRADRPGSPPGHTPTAR